MLYRSCIEYGMAGLDSLDRVKAADFKMRHSRNVYLSRPYHKSASLILSGALSGYDTRAGSDAHFEFGALAAGRS